MPDCSWAALAVIAEKPDIGSGSPLRVEHGTPRRGLAPLVLDLRDEGAPAEDRLAELFRKYWKLAVISHEEDRRLNKIARSKAFSSPDARWAGAGILFSSSESDKAETDATK